MSDYQTDDRLAAIEKRLNKATPGPWFQGREHERYELETDVFNEREMSATSTDVASCQEIVDATFVAHAPEDVAWLVSEVRRYRDEENPNQAAKYWRTIVTQRQMIENQAATIEKMQRALSEIDRTGCEKSTARRCFDTIGLSRDAQYTADKWCDACVAADALGRES